GVSRDGSPSRPKNEAKFGTPWKCVPTTFNVATVVSHVCPSHRDKLRSVVNPFSFSLLVDRLRHFLVESIALPSFRQPLVFHLDIHLALLREGLDFFLQTISFGTRFGDASVHLLFRSFLKFLWHIFLVDCI